MDKLQVKNPIYPLLALASSVLVLVIGLIIVRQAYFPWLLLALCILYAAFGFIRPLLRSLLFLIPVSLVFALTSLLFQRQLMIAIQMGGRIMLAGLTALPVLATPQIYLTRNLTQLRFPRQITLGMLIAIRFVPVLADEVRQVKAAMKTRGASASLLNLSCLYRAFIIPLMMRLIGISDTMAMSLETRGFRLDQADASQYKPVVFSWRDGFYAAAVLILITMMFYLQ